MLSMPPKMPPKRRGEKDEHIGILLYPAALFYLAYNVAKEIEADKPTKQFDEFIKYIERTGKKTGFQGSTGVGTNLTPDVLDTVKRLNAAGYKNQLEPGKLLPDNFNIADSPNFQKMMGPIMNNIDATRLAMKDETGSIQLNNIQVACKSSHSQYLSPLLSLEKMAAVTVIVTVTEAVTDFAYCSERGLRRSTGGTWRPNARGIQRVQGQAGAYIHQRVFGAHGSRRP